MSDESALLAAIMAHPDEDTPRLAYADWLDEFAQPQTVACPHCKNKAIHRCNFCDGDGTNGDYHSMRQCVYCDGRGHHRPDCKVCSSTGTIIRPDSNAARAELIRVQCATHTLLFSERHRKAEAAILREWEDRWRRGPKCGKCHGKGELQVPDWHPPGSAYCDSCYGTGDAGGLLREFHYLQPPGSEHASMGLVRVAYSRGMKVVTVPSLSDCVVDAVEDYADAAGDMDQRDVLVPSPWLAAVVRHHPDVEAVCVLDRVPQHWSNDNTYYFQFWDEGTGPTYRVPKPIAEEMRRLNAHKYSESTSKRHLNLHYPTTDTATLALGRAVVRWARTCAQASPAR